MRKGRKSYSGLVGRHTFAEVVWLGEDPAALQNLTVATNGRDLPKCTMKQKVRLYVPYCFLGHLQAQPKGRINNKYWVGA